MDHHQSFLDFTSLLDGGVTDDRPTPSASVEHAVINSTVLSHEDQVDINSFSWRPTTGDQVQQHPVVDQVGGNETTSTRPISENQLLREFETIQSELEKSNTPHYIPNPNGLMSGLVDHSTATFGIGSLREAEQCGQSTFPTMGLGNSTNESSRENEKVEENPVGMFDEIFQEEIRLGLVSTHLHNKVVHERHTEQYPQVLHRSRETNITTSVDTQQEPSSIIIPSWATSVPPNSSVSAATSLQNHPTNMNTAYGNPVIVIAAGQLPQTIGYGTPPMHVSVGEYNNPITVQDAARDTAVDQETVYSGACRSEGMFQTNVAVSESSFVPMRYPEHYYIQGTLPEIAYQQNVGVVFPPGMPQYQILYPHGPQGTFNHPTSFPQRQNSLEGIPMRHLLQASVAQRLASQKLRSFHKSQEESPPLPMASTAVKRRRSNIETGKSCNSSAEVGGGGASASLRSHETIASNSFVVGSRMNADEFESSRKEAPKKVNNLMSPSKSNASEPVPLKSQHSGHSQHMYEMDSLVRAPATRNRVALPIPAKVENFVEIERSRRREEEKAMMERFWKGYSTAGKSATATDDSLVSCINGSGSSSLNRNKISRVVGIPQPEKCSSNRGNPLLRNLLEKGVSTPVHTDTKRQEQLTNNVEDILMTNLLGMIFEIKPSSEKLQVNDAHLGHMESSSRVAARVREIATEPTEKLTTEEQDRVTMDKFLNYVFQEGKDPDPMGSSENPVTVATQQLPQSQRNFSRIIGNDGPKNFEEFELNDLLRRAANEMLGQTQSTTKVFQRASDSNRLSYNDAMTSPVKPQPPLIDLTRNDPGGGGDHNVSSSTPDSPDATALHSRSVQPQAKLAMPALFLQGLLKLKLKFQQFEERTRRPLEFSRKFYAAGTNQIVNKVLWITASLLVMEDIISEIDREIGRRSECVSLNPKRSIANFAVHTFDILMRSAKWIIGGAVQASLASYTHTMFLQTEATCFPMHVDMPRYTDSRSTAPTNLVWRFPHWMEHTRALLKLVYGGDTGRINATYRYLAALRP